MVATDIMSEFEILMTVATSASEVAVLDFSINCHLWVTCAQKLVENWVGRLAIEARQIGSLESTLY
jgi:hypothetical protein